MASDAKLTNSTEEYTLMKIFTERAQFGIPYFQRPYKWGKKQIDRFIDDLSVVVDIEGESHFLGAIIMFERYTPLSLPTAYQIIDGQQRVTTCFLALAAIVKSYLDHGFEDDALNLYNSTLIIPALQKGHPNSKLISCKTDRAALNAVFEDLNTLGLSNGLGDNRFRPLGSDLKKEGAVWRNYGMLKKFFNKAYEESEKLSAGSGKETLDSYYASLMNHMTLVWIVVKDPTDGPKIFNSLNSKQEPMTIGDLVRNEVFSKISNEPDAVVEMIDENHWRPFYEKFEQGDEQKGDKIFEQYFFPFALTLKNSVQKAGAFNFLRDRWAKEDDPAVIISELEQYQDIYLDLCYGSSFTTGISDGIAKSLKSLNQMKAPNSIYPFVFQAVKAAQNSNIDVHNVEEMLHALESFLVRRGVCGYEPTGLHAVFKTLWSDCDGEYTASRMYHEIRRHATVAWPDDQEFGREVVSRPLYKVKITPYLLAEWNAHLSGDVAIVSGVQIEHVLPDTLKHDSKWTSDWSEKEWKENKDCLANLLPLSQSLNGSIKNSDYAIKRERYLQDSALKAPRDFANTFGSWTPKDFDRRAEEMRVWCLQRWDV